jgi:MoxR-like ATPase
MARKFLELMETLDRFVVHRAWEVEGLVYGLLTGYPTMWIGPIGIAKTYTIDILTSLIKDAVLFRYMLTKFTEPEELFGAYDIRMLKKGRIIRVTKGKLPEADIVYLDEPFKASSAIRNALLDIILYRRFYNGERYIETKTKAMYMSANEVPILTEDLAFIDRSAIRMFSMHLTWDEMEDVLATPTVRGKISGVGYVLSISDIEEAQREVDEIERTVGNSPELRKLIVSLAKASSENAEKSGEKMEISERRLNMVRRVVAVVSYVYDEEPSADHVAIATAYALPSSWSTYIATLTAINQLLPDSSIAYINKIQTVKTEIKNATSEADKASLSNKLAELIKNAPKRHFLKKEIEKTKF